jgi:hypothetical protein
MQFIQKQQQSVTHPNFTEDSAVLTEVTNVTNNQPALENFCSPPAKQVSRCADPSPPVHDFIHRRRNQPINDSKKIKRSESLEEEELLPDQETLTQRICDL